MVRKLWHRKDNTCNRKWIQTHCTYPESPGLGPGPAGRQALAGILSSPVGLCSKFGPALLEFSRLGVASHLSFPKALPQIMVIPCAFCLLSSVSSFIIADPHLCLLPKEEIMIASTPVLRKIPEARVGKAGCIPGSPSPPLQPWAWVRVRPL